MTEKKSPLKPIELSTPQAKGNETSLFVTPTQVLLGDLAVGQSALRAIEEMNRLANPSIVEFVSQVKQAQTIAESARNQFAHLSSWESIVNPLGHSQEFRKELSSLRDQIADKVRELENERRQGKESKKANAQLEKLVKELQKKEEIGFLLSRVNAAAGEKLKSDEAFRGRLLQGQDCDAFVVSVDIRRSTELMLKARNPQLFAEFISSLCADLFSCIVENYGVFDKFTGDGILAFFPEQFTGNDACYRAIKAAEQCHAVFEKRYRESRKSFSSVLMDVGLGIGIDFGQVRLLKVAEGLTVVGAPVVYACRLSGAPAGRTYLNQPAFEKAQAQLTGHCHFDEVTHSIKHEGEILAYSVRFGHTEYAAGPPDWLTSPRRATE